MSWKTDIAFKRIFNVFKRNKEKVYKEDIEALKLINETLEEANKQFVTKNLLYAKLLAVQLNQNLVHYSDMKMAIKKVSEDLTMPLSVHLEFLKTNLNDIDIIKFYKSIGLFVGNPNLMTEEEKENDLKLISENQKEIIEKMKNSWGFDEVEKSFVKTANEFLKEVTYYE